MLADERRDLVVFGVALGLLGCAALRLAGLTDPGAVELLPVLAAGYWLGRRPALVTAAAAGVILVLSELGDPGFPDGTAAVRAPLLLLVAYTIGTLGETMRRQSAELDRMRPLQDVLAPRDPVEVPLLELASHYVPAQAGVSGDFYLVAEGRNTATVIVIGDVAGKGIEAARRAVFARATVSACAPYSDDPSGILRTANSEMIRQYGRSTQFVTMLCVIVHPDGTVSWASAGHPPPVSLGSGEPIGSPAVGYPLGIAPEIPHMEVAHTVLPAEGLLLHTDGLTDARPPDGSFQPFGEHRIGMFLRELEDPTPQEAIDTLARACEVFAGGALPDDLCMVALRSKFKHAWHAAPAQAEPARA